MCHYDHLHRRYIYETLRGLNCPRSLTAWLLFANNEHEQLVNLEFIPSDYNTLVDARDSLLATKFLSKATFLKTGIDTQKVAMAKFLEAEQACGATNRRVANSRLDDETLAVISTAREKVSNILGVVPFAEILEACDWGPGSTLSVRRRSATKPQKYLIESDITLDALDLIYPFHFSANPRLSRSLRVVRGNRVVSVPKNAKTDRTIAIEPGINLWYQKGIGSVLRRRLNRAGIDLNDQRHNQRLARLGSLHNELATVDFSSASDTISKAVCRELLPASWLALLEAFRSSCAIVNGEPLYYEKFSSMGNGFTFELETLIFYSIALGCKKLHPCDGQVSVYGDDVIIPSQLYPLYSRVCEQLGFTVNSHKSFSCGYYRESCGKHYWDGVDIQPIFFKEPLDGNNAILRQANALRILSHRRVCYMHCDGSLRRAWLVLVGSLRGKIPRVPLRLGDAGLIVNHDEPGVKCVVKPRGYEGFALQALSHVARRSYVEHEGLLAFCLRQVGNDCEPLYNEVPQPMHGRSRLTTVYVSHWDDLGSWV